MSATNTGLLTVPLCYTRFEFADTLRVSVRTADRMIADGEIRVVRVRGKTVRILRAEVERYLNGTKDSAPQAVPSPQAPLPSDGRGWRRTLPDRGGEGETNFLRGVLPPEDKQTEQTKQTEQ